MIKKGGEKTMYKIYLVLRGTQWITIHEDPEVKELFGTAEIPTAFTHLVPKAEVIAELSRLNPGNQIICRG